MIQREQPRKLHLDDFQAPHQVLCYGAGAMGIQWASSYLRMGINVVGFIDKYKSGTMDLPAGRFPIYSIRQAADGFGNDVVVIITISNAKLFDGIIADLQEAGIKNVLSYDFVNWITVPSKKRYCYDLFHSAMLSAGGLMRCCRYGMERVFIPEAFGDRSVEETCKAFLDKTDYYYEQALKGEIPLYCVGCPLLEDKEIPEPKVRAITFGVTANCNLDCIYCTTMQSDLSTMPCDAKEAGENFLSIVNYLVTDTHTAADAQIDFIGGEISVSPVREQLLDFAEKHQSFKYHFYSNCVLYSEKIARILSISDDNYIFCDLDAGTPETYFLVKGYNCFDRVVKNLKDYANHGRVNLKYILLPGFNATDADYIGTIKLMKELGVPNLILSPDFQHPIDEYTERKVVYEAARFKKMLEDNQLTASISKEFFGQRRAMLTERFYRQM